MCNLFTKSRFISTLDPFIQGYNARKVISEVYASLTYSVLSLGGNVNTRRMSKPDMGSIFHTNNQLDILVKGNYYVNYKNYNNLSFKPPGIHIER